MPALHSAPLNSAPRKIILLSYTLGGQRRDFVLGAPMLLLDADRGVFRGLREAASQGCFRRRCAAVSALLAQYACSSRV